MVSEHAFENKDENPFVRVMAQGLSRYGYKTDHGIDAFWSHPGDYDLLWLHWPEDLFGWKQATREDLNRLQHQLQQIRNQGVRIMATCHNLEPHNGDPVMTEAYRMVYHSADIIHHMGHYSCSLFQNRYPEKRHFVAPHPIYEDMQSVLPTKKVCRKRLGLKKHKTVMLCFGSFRNEEERLLIYDIKKAFPQLTVLAPRFQRLKFWDRWRPAPRNIIKYYRHRYQLDIHIARHALIAQNDIKYYLGAADFLFIQRKKILNSGNLPLAFSAGLPVVGPALGNVGEILSQAANPVFTPSDTDSLATAIGSILASNTIELGSRNHAVAMARWQPDNVCRIIDNEISSTFTPAHCSC